MGMAEYIEREEIRRAYEKLTRSYVNGDPYIAGWWFDEMIESLPAANVATVRLWIPVAERLPEKNKEVVGWYKDNPFSPFRYGIVSWNGHGWVFTYAQRYVDAVTYWMPLPEPPKEETP